LPGNAVLAGYLDTMHILDAACSLGLGCGVSLAFSMDAVPDTRLELDLAPPHTDLKKL
jgi:hypothetical protein